MKLSTSAAVVLNVLGALLFAVVTCDGPIRRSLVAENASKIKVSVLRKQMEAIPAWAHGIKVSGPEAADREIFTSVSTRFHTDRPAEEVIEYYSSFALTQGWVPINSQLIWQKWFCRNGISLLVKTSRLDRGVDYTIALAWTDQVRSRSYCPQSPAKAI